jgi:deoxycytidine triphosphate deaminase
MYVCDKHLRDLLPQIDVRAEEGTDPFQPDEAIQPASVDLRLSAVFWKPLRRFTIDLRRSRLLEVQPRRYYRKVVLGAGETILLRPRQMLLGRTAEEFSVPNGYAAELIGRSSFARMGLMVSAAGGYINPGWRGHMPLQLVNFSPNPIRLVAGLPICQVRFGRLTDLAERPYGDASLQSIYLDDDGGPSYWWRDKRIKKLHELLAERSVEARIQRQLDAVIGRREPEVIERLEKHVSRTRVAEVSNAEAMLEDFAHREERRRTLRRWAINLSRASFTVGITASLFVASKLPPLEWWHWTTWGVAAGLVALSVYAFRTEVGDHFGQAELRESCRGDGT